MVNQTKYGHTFAVCCNGAAHDVCRTYCCVVRSPVFVAKSPRPSLELLDNFFFIGLLHGCTNSGRLVAWGNKFVRGVKIQGYS